MPGPFMRTPGAMNVPPGCSTGFPAACSAGFTNACSGGFPAAPRPNPIGKPLILGANPQQQWAPSARPGPPHSQIGAAMMPNMPGAGVPNQYPTPGNYGMGLPKPGFPGPRPNQQMNPVILGGNPQQPWACPSTSRAMPQQPKVGAAMMPNMPGAGMPNHNAPAAGYGMGLTNFAPSSRAGSMGNIGTMRTWA